MSPKESVRKVVREWYGLFTMPMMVLTCEEELVRFERNHPEVPPLMWEFINHRKRQAFLWSRRDDVDVVVRVGDGYKMIQDLYFKDAFDSDQEWRQKCQEEIEYCPEVYVVFHDGDDPE